MISNLLEKVLGSVELVCVCSHRVQSQNLGCGVEVVSGSIVSLSYLVFY